VFDESIHTFGEGNGCVAMIERGCSCPRTLDQDNISCTETFADFLIAPLLRPPSLKESEATDGTCIG
jgi:hypothetical protein